MSTISGRWKAVAGVAAALASFVSTSTAVTATHTSSDPVQLPAAAAVGQVATLSVDIDTTVSGAPAEGRLALRLGMSREVAAVDAASGAFTMRSHIASLEVSQAPVGFDVSPLDSLDGVSIQQTFDRTGAVASPGSVENAASDAQAAGGRQLVDWLAVTSVGFPAEPVVIGASWTSAGTAAGTNGVSVAVVYQCRLAAVADRQYTIEVSYAQGFSVPDTAIGQFDGTISGQGTLTGSLDNPLVLSGTVNQIIDGIATMNGVATPTSVTSAIALQWGG